MDIDKINKLDETIEILLSEDGCPWDRIQTPETIGSFIVEEAYEVYDAINKKDDTGIMEELGDVLFLLAFCAKLKENEGKFDFNDVIENVTNKMRFRHPNIFLNKEKLLVDEILKNWNELKKEEKGFKSDKELLQNISSSMPALLQAEKVIKRSNKMKEIKINPLETFTEIRKYVDLLENQYLQENTINTTDFLELLFKIVIISVKFEINPEIVLTNYIKTFINEFE